MLLPLTVMVRVGVCGYRYCSYILCSNTTVLRVSHYSLRLQSLRIGLSFTSNSHPKRQTAYLQVSVQIVRSIEAETFKMYRHLSLVLSKGFEICFLFSNNCRNRCISRNFNITRTIDRNSNSILRQNGLPQKSIRDVAANSKVKPKIFILMSKIEREIRKLQRSTKILASQKSFKECIKMCWLI